MARRRDAVSNLKGSLVTGGGTGLGGDVYLGLEERTISPRKRKPSKVVTDKTTNLADALAKAYTWTDAERQAFVAKARSLGYTDVTDLTSPNLWAMAVKGASDWYKNSNRTVKITPEQYLEWYAKANKLGQPAQPTTNKTITQYGAPQIRDWINDGLTKKFGRTFESLTQEERSILFNAVKDYSEKAAVTVSKPGIEGQGRTTTIVKPGATTAGIQEVIEKTAMTMPELISDKERQDSINFYSWFSQNVPGA